MGNVALSAEDVSFLKEKGANKTTTSEIKKAFKEFAEVLLIFKKHFLVQSSASFRYQTL